MGYEIFISYSSVDKVVANAVCSNLETAQFRCWIAPRDVQVGRPWAESIIKALNEVGIMVLIFSQHSNASKQVILEVERAVSKGISIVPFRIDKVKPTAALEYFLSVPHWLDAIDPPMQAHINRLVTAVRSLAALNQPLPSVSPQQDAVADQKFLREFEEIAPDDWNRGASPNFIARMFRKLLEER